ncbi:MAG: hypothetical protein R3320_05930 [Nitriliruptorales bacterium]|nr:hypothetical protein [Nitriliruptorales bacterium]
MEIAVGVALLLLGATAASSVTHSLERSGRTVWLPLALVPPGVLIGAGAAMVRSWSLWGTIAAGAVGVPLAGMAFAVVRRRRLGQRS